MPFLLSVESSRLRAPKCKPVAIVGGSLDFRYALVDSTCATGIILLMSST